MNVLLLNRPSPAGATPSPGLTATARGRWLVAQGVAGAWIIASFTVQSAHRWRSEGDDAPRSALYGIWDVDTMKVDGMLRAPLLTDPIRYHRIVFQSPTRVAFQRMDQSFTRFDASIDTVTHEVIVKNDGKAVGVLTYQRSSPARLDLAGLIEGRKMEATMSRHDMSTFILLTRGFHWVQEAPFSR